MNGIGVAIRGTKRYEYITFDQLVTKGKTSAWRCRNNASATELGQIRWHGPWRQYCYFTTVQAVYSAGCLRDIGDFIRQAMEARG